ncbi:MAG: 50S ribosomal protein L29 [Terriglobales bacterium]
MKNNPMERLRQMGPQELDAREADLRDQLFRMRFQLSTGQAESIKKLRQTRRDIARVKTLKTQHARAAAAEPGEGQ